jgi:CDP-glycerol glycerophosphotransferase (TagB/SpsB family)
MKNSIKHCLVFGTIIALFIGSFGLKEVCNFCNFFLLIPKNKKSIVFYSEKESYFSYYEGVITELTKNNNATICYITSDKNDSILKTNNTNIKSFYLNKLLPLFMRLVNTKVFVMTLTDLNQFSLKRSVNPVTYVYLFHAMVSTHMVYREGSFDHYDIIACPCDYHIQEIKIREKQNNLKQKKLIPGGYYRLERIYQAAQNYPRSTVKKTILIAPSWGQNNIFETCGKQLIQKLLNKGFAVIARPHPEITKRNPLLMKEYELQFKSNHNFTLETSVKKDTSILKADLLITDFSGIALEYAFGTERPVIFVDLPHKIKNPNHKELGIEPFELSVRSDIGIIVNTNQINNIDEISLKLIEKQNEYKNKIISLRKKHIYNFGKSSEIAAKIILDSINTEK